MSYADGEGKTHNVLRKILRRKAWWTAAQLQRAYELETGEFRLDATITRRIREMSDTICQRRRVKNCEGDFVWRDCYQLVKVKAAA